MVQSLAFFGILFIGGWLCTCHTAKEGADLPNSHTWANDIFSFSSAGIFRSKQMSKNRTAVQNEKTCESNTIVDAVENHTATLIWLHSFGDSGFHFADSNELDLPGTLAMPWSKYIFPTACELNITLFGGKPQSAWFDVSKLESRGIQQDESGLRSAAHRIAELISAELAAGIPPHRVVLAGFGQVRSKGKGCQGVTAGSRRNEEQSNSVKGQSKCVGEKRVEIAISTRFQCEGETEATGELSSALGRQVAERREA
jgi:hypothetical protein